MVADGKIYFGTGKQEFWTLEAGRQVRILGRSKLRAKMYNTPVAANGVLFVASEKYIYAVEVSGGEKKQ
jgi:sugar lactone lactonase YvrE